MTPREAEKIILADGWQLQEIQGSHHQYTHPTKPGKVTIPFHTLNSILKQAGLK